MERSVEFISEIDVIVGLPAQFMCSAQSEPTG